MNKELSATGQSKAKAGSKITPNAISKRKRCKN